MANSDGEAEMPALPQTPNSIPFVNLEPPNPGLTISLLEIGSLPTFCWGSFQSSKDSIRPLGRPGTVQKFSNLLKDVKDVLRSIAGVEETTTSDLTESYDDVSSSRDVSELKIRGLDKRNKMGFKYMPINLDPEREQNTKKQELILKNQSAKNIMQTYVRDLCNSEGKRGFYDMELNMGRGRYGSFHLHGDYKKFRNNLEMLMHEADHWSKQHNELNGQMKSYQECQKDRRESVEKNRVCFQTQPNNELSSKRELEAQVKKLSHDTHSLHLIAALLENECQILQQRVDILRELHLHELGPFHERLLPVYYEQDKKWQKPAEVDKMDANKQPGKATEGMIPKKEKISRNSDACLSKKARNNRFNSRIAKKTPVGKRRTISSSR